MPEAIKVSATISVGMKRLYEAWLDSMEHSAFTGGEALIDPIVGGRFTAWDGYIEGTTLELKPNKRIVQSWRTSDFPKGAPDSKLEILFESAKTGTKMTFIHTEIPNGQGKNYKDGWKDFYFTPMKAYFKDEAKPKKKGK